MSESAGFNPKQFRLVEGQLVPGERLGWVGRPVIAYYTLQDIRGMFWLPLGLASLALLLTITSTRQSEMVSRQQIVTGLIFTSLFIMGIMLLVNCVYASRTIYAVTDQRAIILEPYFAGFGRRIPQSYGYHVMGIIECEPMLRSRVGNVIFKRAHIGFQHEFIGKNQPRSIVDRIGFFAIRDACELAHAMSQYVYVK